jgi:hypothetical protein
MLIAKTQEWMNTAKDVWCQVVHDQAMWPINGRYQCRTCLRYHPVAWEQPESRGAGEKDMLQSGNSQVTAVAAQ